MKNGSQLYSPHLSVAPDQGIRVDRSVAIARPVQEVFRFWRNLENLPRFMNHLESVAALDDRFSHWAVRGPGGVIFEWDAEIIEQRPNSMISWRSLPGADVDNAGSVWFTSLPANGLTIVRVELKYVPPAGKPGDMIARFLGSDPHSAVTEDLNRLKELLETGQPEEEECQKQEAVSPSPAYTSFDLR